MSLTRRDFIKASCLSLAALAFAPVGDIPRPWMPEIPADRSMLGRVTRAKVPVYTLPDLDSPRLAKLGRDDLVNLLEEVASPHGPVYNPRWYRLEQGYLHSAYVQRVDGAHFNKPLLAVPPAGLLGEITVPYAQTLYQNRQGGWISLYRLYYGSVHWITGLDDDSGGEPLYRLTDEWRRVHYWVPAKDVLPIPAEALAPISPDLPAEEKRLEVSIERQTMVAYEGREMVRIARVSTGRRYTPTPPGEFRVDRKHPSKHMGNGALTGDLKAYELVGVPWVSFFQTAGIAFHGTFWHDNYGYPMSNGCVNLTNADALWLFRWTTPTYAQQYDDRPTWKVVGKGGTVVVVM